VADNIPILYQDDSPDELETDPKCPNCQDEIYWQTWKGDGWYHCFGCGAEFDMDMTEILPEN
jgi:DNA-directed RNA polymerase subunit RPC12/RpoP